MNNVKNFPIKKVLDIFAANSSKSELEELEKNGYIEKAKRFRSGAIVKKGWGLNSLPKIGEQIGFFPKFSDFWGKSGKNQEHNSFLRKILGKIPFFLQFFKF